MCSKALDEFASVRRKIIVEEKAKRDDRKIQELTNKFQDIRAVLDDEEVGQVGVNGVGGRLVELKKMFFDIDDELDELNTAIWNASMRTRKVRSYLLTCRLLFLRRDVALKLKNLSQTLDGSGLKSSDPADTGDIEQERPMISVVDSSQVIVRDGEKNRLLNLLLCESSEKQTTLPIISIVGMDGSGKTTLSRQVFDIDAVKTHFSKRIWVSASYPEIRIARAILESLKDGVSSDLVEIDTVLQQISHYIQGNRFLLVLDDVRSRYFNYWQQLMYSLKSGSEGSRILVTTCEENVINKMGNTRMISLGTLSEEASWSLFCLVAFYWRRSDEEFQELEHIGRQVIRKCKNLPLTVKVIGSHLRFKRNIGEWLNVLNSKIWELKPAEKEHFLPLLLSYYDLPSALRKCFLYCAIFPKNYEIEKDRLIKLWMAQGYLKVEGRDDTELIGEEFFESLASHSLLHDFQKNEFDGRIIRCKMHNIVHDFAQFLTINECFNLEVNGFEMCPLESNENIKHLMIKFETERKFPTSVYNRKRLRSLVVERGEGFMTGINLSALFDNLTCLRSLDLSNQDNGFYNVIKRVPRGIRKLLHLRYLNLSRNSKIAELPESLCELYNLETMELSWCISLKRLPQRMGQLINLWHLVNDGTSLSYMPKGIERLTCLRTLNEFIVSVGSDDDKACKLECLKSLNHLRGSLKIKKLGNVSKDEINKAELGKKENLLALYLSLEKDRERGSTNKDDEDALEGLQVPPNLERLEIFYHRGNTLSSIFIMSLAKLRSMSLDRCINLEQLPRLGELPSLESLTVRNMRRLEKVGNEFLGIDESRLLRKDEGKVLGTDRSRSSGIEESKPSKPFVAFPRLKSLEFQKMKGWKEWKYSVTTSTWPHDRLMPHLCSLTIGFCPKLETLPDDYLPQLLDLKIISCPKLEERYKEGTAERGNISHVNLYFS